MELKEFNRQMQERGWVIFHNFVSEDLIARMLNDLESAYSHCRLLQIKADLPNTEGTTHHLIGQGNSFMEYRERFEDLNKYTEAYFNGKYILNSFGGNMLSKGMSYASDIHRDIRTFSGTLPLMLNTIVMLNDFTHENGATWLMNRGHERADKPSEFDFGKSKFQVIGKAGSVVFFNSNMWHRAGNNTTDAPRRSVTPMFTKPFFKPQFDYPRALGYDKGNTYSPYLKQVLGYNNRIPVSLQEWYSPTTERFYKGD